MKLIIGILLCWNIIHSQKIEWDEIAIEDWNFKIPDSVSIKHSAIIFEKYIQDDDGLYSGEFYFTIYKRVRVFNDKGRYHSDVKVPMLHPYGKIKSVNGRTILRNGEVINLTKNHIFKKEAVKTDDDKIEQTYFYLPGVTSNCIIEYKIEYELPSLVNIWTFENEIFTKYSELTWYYYGKHSKEVNSNVFIGANYVTNSDSKYLKVEHITKGNDRLIFSAENIPPYKNENYSLGKRINNEQVTLFYNFFTNSTQFWVNVTNSIEEIQSALNEKSEETKKIIDLMPANLNREEKIYFLYEWVQQNIVNIENEKTGEEYEIRKSYNDIIKYKYGNHLEMNLLFNRLLNLCEIRSFPVLGVSRYKYFFNYEATYNQFNDLFIGIKGRNREITYYNPSDKNLPPGFINSYYEGTFALNGSKEAKLTVIVPFSDYKKNILNANFNVEINRQLISNATFNYEFKGHFANEFKDLIEIVDKYNYPIEDIFNEYPGLYSVDSIRIDTMDYDLNVNGEAVLEQIVSNSGNIFTINPFKLIDENEVVRDLSNRKYEVMFDYPYTKNVNIKIKLPSKFMIYSLPKNISTASRVGDVKISYKLNKDNSITIDYMYRLRKSFIKKDEFSRLEYLIEKNTDINKQRILLIDKETI